MLLLELTKPAPRLRMGIDRLMAAAQEAGSWRDWYERHEPLVHELFGEDAQLFKAILAATSVRASVPSNVGLALKAYGQMKRGQPFMGFFPAVIQNLERIRGEQALFGRKVGQFHNAMTNKAEQVAVDQHIGELLFGTPKPSPAQITKAKQIITQVAQKLGWQPREVQASLWAYNKLNRGEKPETVHTYQTVLNNKRAEIAAIRQAIQQTQAPMAA